MRGYLSVISGFLLPALQLLIIQRYITTLFGPGNRKPAGMIIWFLYYALGQFTRNYTQTTKRGLLTTNKG